MKTRDRVVLPMKWVPSLHWEGRRWELWVGLGVVGRVVKFVDGQVQASRYYPKYRTLEGTYSTLEAAGRALEKDYRAGEKA